MGMAKKALLCAMGFVFFGFAAVLFLDLGEIIAGVDLSIVTAVILIILFVGYIMVSERERKGRKPRM